MLYKTIHKLNLFLSTVVHNLLLFFEMRPRSTQLVLFLIVLGFFITGLRIIDEPKSGIGMEYLLSSSHSDFDDYFGASKSFLTNTPDPYRIHNLARAREIIEKTGGSMAGLFEALPLLKGVGSYLYPPFTAFLLVPLQSFDYTTSALIYLFISITCFVLWILASVQFAKSSGVDQNKSQSLILVLILLLIGFLYGNIANGNIGFILILLCAMGLTFSFSRNLFLSAFGGFLIGLACIMKITPIFLAGLLFAGRRIHALFGFVVGIAFALLIPGLSFGIEGNLSYLSDWYFLVIENFQDIVFIRSWINNQSIGGMIGRLFLEGQEVKQAKYGLPIGILSDLSGQSRVYFFAGIVKIINMILFLILFISSFLMFARDGWKNAFLSFIFKDKEGDKPNLLDIQMIRFCMMVLIASQLISGVSWYHSWGILIVGLFFWFIHLHFKNMIKSSEKLYLVFLFLFGFLYQFFPSPLKEVLSIYSVFTIGMSILFIWISFEFFRTYGKLKRLKQRESNGI